MSDISLRDMRESRDSLRQAIGRLGDGTPARARPPQHEDARNASGFARLDGRWLLVAALGVVSVAAVGMLIA